MCTLIGHFYLQVELQVQSETTGHIAGPEWDYRPHESLSKKVLNLIMDCQHWGILRFEDGNVNDNATNQWFH